MMLMLLTALAVFQAEEPPRTPGPATDRTFSVARDALDGVLIDYPSARFRDVTANAGLVCGKVNGKNRMGAYSGWTGFVVMMVEPPSVRVGDDEALVQALCNDENKPRSPDYSDRLTARP